MAEYKTASAINIKQEEIKQQMEAKLRKFVKNYRVTVENDTKRCAVYNAPVKFFDNPHDASICTTDYAVTSERLYTISIPESRLEALVDMEHRISRYHAGAGNVDLLTLLLDKERQETSLRAQNEGIKKAYEQYSLLLHLAGYQRNF